MGIRRSTWVGLLAAAVGTGLGAIVPVAVPAPAPLPGAAIATNKTAYRPGDAFTLSVTLSNPGAARSLDAYLGVQLPDGRTTLYLTAAGFGQTMAPIARGLSLAAGASLGPVSVLSVTLPPSVSPGTYTWTLTLTDPDTPGAIVTSTGASISVQAQAGFQLEMPILASDMASNFFTLNPFGIHIAEHTYDGGHPGWDVEYAAGASVRAGADGTVQSVMTDFHDPTKITIQIMHQFGQQGYRTVYTNIENPVVAVGQRVTAGQPIGTAGRVTFNSGSSQVVYYMTHYQLDDFSYTNPLTGASNRNAVSPEPFLSPPARAIFDRLWAVAAYNAELVEPFATMPRNALNPFPIRRTWTLQSKPPGSDLPARIDFTWRDPAATPGAPAFTLDYALIDGTGATVESGTAQVRPKTTPPSLIDLQPRGPGGQAAGPARAGLYDIVGGTMRMDFGAPGAARPNDLSNAAGYTTQ